MSTENTPSKSVIKSGESITLTTRFGGLSRGKCWGKFFPGQTKAKGDFQWVEKDSNGTLTLEGPGFYIVGSSDGFSRKAQAEFTLEEWTVEWAVDHQEKKIKASEELGLDTEIELTVRVGSLKKGETVTRRALVEERRKIIAELQSQLATA